MFETLSPPEQSCIRNELDAGQLTSALQGPLLRFFTLPAPWQVDFFRCLDPETGLFLLIYWLGEGSEGLTANSISCAPSLVGWKATLRTTSSALSPTPILMKLRYPEPSIAACSHATYGRFATGRFTRVAVKRRLEICASTAGSAKRCELSC